MKRTYAVIFILVSGCGPMKSYRSKTGSLPAPASVASPTTTPTSVTTQASSALPACSNTPISPCGFNYSSGYASINHTGVWLTCKIRYIPPGSNGPTAEKIFYSSCANCTTTAIDGDSPAYPTHSSYEGPIYVVSGKRCYGTPTMDVQYRSQHSFLIETLSDSSCTKPDRYFSYADCR